MSLVQHSTASGTDLHEDKRIKEPVRAASTANVNTASPGSTLDGVTLTSGDRILLKDQTTASQNGIYAWSGSSSALVRTTDADTAADFVYGFEVFVREGTANAGTYWVMAQTAAITLGTTAISFTPIVPAVQSASAAAVATSGTITTSGVTVARVNPAAAVTGVILQAGTRVGQEVWVVNEAAAANTVTFAAAGTSNVADGTGSVIAGLTAAKFVWQPAAARWFRAA